MVPIGSNWYHKDLFSWHFWRAIFFGIPCMSIKFANIPASIFTNIYVIRLFLFFWICCVVGHLKEAMPCKHLFSSVQVWLEEVLEKCWCNVSNQWRCGYINTSAAQSSARIVRREFRVRGRSPWKPDQPRLSFRHHHRQHQHNADTIAETFLGLSVIVTGNISTVLSCWH